LEDTHYRTGKKAAQLYDGGKGRTRTQSMLPASTLPHLSRWTTRWQSDQLTKAVSLADHQGQVVDIQARATSATAYGARGARTLPKRIFSRALQLRRKIKTGRRRDNL